MLDQIRHEAAAPIVYMKSKGLITLDKSIYIQK